MGTKLIQGLGLGLLLMGLSAGAAAGPYVGVALGSTLYNEDDAAYFGIEDESTAFEALIGFRLMDVLALEASYLGLGDVYDYQYDTDTNFSGITMSGKALLPLGPQMDLFAKIGVYFWEYEEQYGSRAYLIDDGQDLIFGGGATFHLTEEVDLNLEYRELELQDLQASLFTVGVSLVF